MSQILYEEEILRFNEIIDNLKELILFYMEDNLIMLDVKCNEIIDELESIVRFKKNDMLGK